MNPGHTTAATTMIPIPPASTITLDGTSGWDIPYHGSFITVATAGCGVSFSALTSSRPRRTRRQETPRPSRSTRSSPPSLLRYQLDRLQHEQRVTHHRPYQPDDQREWCRLWCKRRVSLTRSGEMLPSSSLTQDTGLTIENLTITGSVRLAPCQLRYRRTWPRLREVRVPAHESEVNLTVNHIGCFAPQGDGMSLQLPKDFGNTSRVLDTNVVVSNSTFESGGGGYHGLVAEAVGPTAACTAQYGVGTPTNPTCGAKFVNNYWNGWPTEMMDFEVDDEESAFGGSGCTSLPGGLCPIDAAQDNMLFANNTYVNWFKQWFSSGQGFGLGVQEQNLVFTNKQVDERRQHRPLHVGPRPHTHRERRQYWTGTGIIENNTETGGFGSTTGGGCSSLPSGSASTFKAW